MSSRLEPTEPDISEEAREAQFLRTMTDNCKELWKHGAGEKTLATLYDLVDETKGGLEWRVADRPRTP